MMRVRVLQWQCSWPYIRHLHLRRSRRILQELKDQMRRVLRVLQLFLQEHLR